MTWIGPDGRRFESEDDVPVEEYYAEDDFEDDLDEGYGDVRVCGYTYTAGRVLRAVDPTAFRCAYNDELDHVRWSLGDHGFEYEDDSEDEEDD